MPKFKYVNITIEDPQQGLLDHFQVCWIKSEESGSYSDEENTGDARSHAALVERIRQYVEE